MNLHARVEMFLLEHVSPAHHDLAREELHAMLNEVETSAATRPTVPDVAPNRGRRVPGEPCTDPDKMHGAGDQFPGSDYE